MGTVHQATVASFRGACRELESWLIGRIEFHGIQFRCVPDSPNTFEDLTSAGIPIPVPTYENRTDTIYFGCNKCLYQAYHDWVHIQTGWDFSLEGEERAADHHLEEALRTGLSADAIVLLQTESILRVRYYLRWGRFPRNEGLGHWIAFTLGPDAYLDFEGM